MIVDNIKNASRYYSLGDRIEKALKFLEKTDLTKLELGRHDIDGDNIFLSMLEYNTRTKEEGKLEAHRKYLDIQLMVEGTEQMGYVELGNQEVEMEYDTERDLIFFNGECDYVTGTTDTFLMFFPNDLHKPNTLIGESKSVRKVVVKILID